MRSRLEPPDHTFDPFHVTHGKERRAPGYQPSEIIWSYSDQFMAQVSVPEMNWQDTETYYASCWLWTGAVRDDGQAFFRPRSMSLPIQRFSYLLHVGLVPDDLVARAACDVRLCVSPRHLHLRPRNSNAATIDLDTREVIRSLRRDHGWTLERLAEHFGVSERSAARICLERDS